MSEIFPHPEWMGGASTGSSATRPVSRSGHRALVLVVMTAGSLSWTSALHAQSSAAEVPMTVAIPTEVRIDNFTFSPPMLTVSVGSTVTWLNADDIPHTIAANDRSFRSKALDTDDHFSFTFTAPGDYDYFCSLHPHMTGRIVVTK
jgi:plastocyanin